MLIRSTFIGNWSIPRVDFGVYLSSKVYTLPVWCIRSLLLHLRDTHYITFPPDSQGTKTERIFKGSWRYCVSITLIIEFCEGGCVYKLKYLWRLQLSPSDVVLFIIRKGVIVYQYTYLELTQFSEGIWLFFCQRFTFGVWVGIQIKRKIKVEVESHDGKYNEGMKGVLELIRSDKIIYWLGRYSFLLGFIMSKKLERFPTELSIRTHTVILEYFNIKE